MYEVPTLLIIFGSVVTARGIQKIYTVTSKLYKDYIFKKNYEVLSPLCENDSMYEQETCVICLDGLDENDKIRKLPCKHVFHKKCIDQWAFCNKMTCPICNDDIFNSLKSA